MHSPAARDDPRLYWAVSIVSVHIAYTERGARPRPRSPVSAAEALAVLAATALPLACSTSGRALLRSLAGRAATAFARLGGAPALAAGRPRPALPAGPPAAQSTAGAQAPPGAR